MKVEFKAFFEGGHEVKEVVDLPDDMRDNKIDDEAHLWAHQKIGYSYRRID